MDQIVGVACLDRRQGLHLTNIKCTMNDIKQSEQQLQIKNLHFPLHWYDKIQICNDKLYQEIINHLNT